MPIIERNFPDRGNLDSQGMCILSGTNHLSSSSPIDRPNIFYTRTRKQFTQPPGEHAVSSIYMYFAPALIMDVINHQSGFQILTAVIGRVLFLQTGFPVGTAPEGSGRNSDPVAASQ